MTMNKLIIKLFGINQMNFWGWIFAAVLVFIGCGVFFAMAYFAFMKKDSNSAIVFLLAAIGLLLVGHFGLAVQTYCSLLAEKLERQQARIIDFEPEGGSLATAYQELDTSLREKKPPGIQSGGHT